MHVRSCERHCSSPIYGLPHLFQATSGHNGTDRTHERKQEVESSESIMCCCYAFCSYTRSSLDVEGFETINHFSPCSLINIRWAHIRIVHVRCTPLGTSVVWFQCVLWSYKITMNLYLNGLLTSFAYFWRVSFSWHPPVLFSSDFGHVTPPLSSACHVTVRSCCR